MEALLTGTCPRLGHWHLCAPLASVPWQLMPRPRGRLACELRLPAIPSQLPVPVPVGPLMGHTAAARRAHLTQHTHWQVMPGAVPASGCGAEQVDTVHTAEDPPGTAVFLSESSWLETRLRQAPGRLLQHTSSRPY